MWREARRNPKPGGRPADPPADWWTPERDLQATIIDLLRILIWQPSSDGHKGINPPKPLRRPGVTEGRSMGKTSLPPEEARAILARIGPAPRTTT